VTTRPPEVTETDGAYRFAVVGAVLCHLSQWQRRFQAGVTGPQIVARPANLAGPQFSRTLTHCGQLILSKKLVNLMPPDVTFVTAKMHKIRFPLGS